MASSIIMENMVVDGENVAVDLNDILDIIDLPQKMLYVVIFKDGEIWKNAKIKRTVFNKFEKEKKKRGQI